MDELNRNGTEKKPTYGEKDRGEFLNWLEGYITRTKAERDKETSAPNRSEKVVGVLNEYCDFLDQELQQQREKTIPAIGDDPRPYQTNMLIMRMNVKGFADAHRQQIQGERRWNETLWPELDLRMQEEASQIKSVIDAREKKSEPVVPTIRTDGIPLDDSVVDDDSLLDDGSVLDDDGLGGIKLGAHQTKAEKDAPEKISEIDLQPIRLKRDESFDESRLDENGLLENAGGKRDRPGEDEWEEKDAAFGSLEEHRANIKKMARALKDARTVVNSKEYSNLITLMEKVGDGKVKKLDGLDERQQLAQELYGIHELTEKYLEHKARDGVKKNSYRKLLAVEKTNQLLARCIENLGDIKVTTGEKCYNASGELVPQTVSLQDLEITLAQRQKDGVSMLSEVTGEEQAKKLLENRPELKSVIGQERIAEGIRSVDACMCAIMLKAKENNLSTKPLYEMRKSFLKDPFPAAEEAQADMTREKKWLEEIEKEAEKAEKEAAGKKKAAGNNKTR